MKVNPSIERRVKQLCEWYGDGRDGTCPAPAQWRHILERPAATALTLINFFKLRDVAAYPDAAEAASGQQAFSRYAEVSMPTMERVGGRFLLVGPYEGMFLGEPEDWDLIAVGSYPDTEAVMALYADPGYRAAFRHRAAACARQKVVICAQ